MESAPYIYAGLLGLIVGSFLNVVIYRLPRKIKFRTGRSFCPQCKNQLKFYHNIPVISFLFLRGKCGFCKMRIPVRYPLVEIMNAALYLYCIKAFGLTLSTAIFAFLFSSLIVIFFIDLDFQIIPDAITLPGIIFGLAISVVSGGIGFLPSLIGMIVGGGSLYLIAILGDLMFKKESMGGGDIKMAAMLGAFLGWQKVVLVFMSAAGIGLVVSLIMMGFSEKLRRERVIPFGPFIALAAMMAIVWGDSIISYYIDNFIIIHN